MFTWRSRCSPTLFSYVNPNVLIGHLSFFVHIGRTEAVRDNNSRIFNFNSRKLTVRSSIWLKIYIEKIYYRLNEVNYRWCFVRFFFTKQFIQIHFSTIVRTKSEIARLDYCYAILSRTSTLDVFFRRKYIRAQTWKNSKLIRLNETNVSNRRQ